MNKIRPVDAADLPECARSYTRCFNGPPWNDNWTVPTALSRLQDVFQTPRFHGLVCEESGQSLGAVFGNLEAWYASYHYQLKEMWIDPASQRQGIGTELMARLCHELNSLGVKGIYLFTSAHMWPADFYAKNGFTRVEDMQMMKRRLEL